MITFENLPNSVQKLQTDLAEIKKLLLERPAQEEPPQWLSINALIEYLPSRPAKQTIYGLVNNKRIPCHRINGKLFFAKAEIDQWIQGKRIFTQQEIDQQAEKFLSNKKGGLK